MNSGSWSLRGPAPNIEIERQCISN